MKNNLKYLREKALLSMRDLSDRLFNRYKMILDPSSISKMERGKQGIYDEQAIVLADFFNVSIDFLLNRDYKPSNGTPIVSKKSAPKKGAKISKRAGFYPLVYSKVKYDLV